MQSLCQLGWSVSLAAAMLFSAGCTAVPETTSRTVDTGDSITITLDEPSSGEAVSVATLRKGMAAEQVEQLLGRPLRRRSIGDPGQNSEIWSYQWRRQDLVRQTAAEVQMVPYNDPVTNQIRMVPEPVYSLETIVVRENLEIEMVDGVVVSWKNYFEEKRSFE